MGPRSCLEEVKMRKILDPTGTRAEIPRSWPVAIPTAMSWLQYKGNERIYSFLVVAITKSALRDRFLAGTNILLLHTFSLKIALQIAYGKRFLGLNRPQNEPNHPLPSGAEVKNSRNILFGSSHVPTWRHLCAQEQFRLLLPGPLWCSERPWGAEHCKPMKLQISLPRGHLIEHFDMIGALCPQFGFLPTA
jgi:hypothetical protein